MGGEVAAAHVWGRERHATWPPRRGPAPLTLTLLCAGAALSCRRRCSSSPISSISSVPPARPPIMAPIVALALPSSPPVVAALMAPACCPPLPASPGAEAFGGDGTTAVHAASHTLPVEAGRLESPMQQQAVQWQPRQQHLPAAGHARAGLPARLSSYPAAPARGRSSAAHLGPAGTCASACCPQKASLPAAAPGPTPAA